MKNSSMIYPLRPLVFLIPFVCLNFAAPAAPEPYHVDPDTLHLWHFDEIQNTNTVLPELSAQDASLQFFYNLSVTNGAKLEAPSFSVPLGGALDSRGIPGSPQYQPGAFGEEDLIYYPDDFASVEGAFTFEALVSPDFDPAIPNVSRPPMQIVSLENEGGTDVRVFQFRLNSTSTNSHWALEFENIGSAAAGSNAPVTVTPIDDFTGIDLTAYNDTVILDAGGTTTNTYAWEIINGTLQITTTVYDGIEQCALTQNKELPIGQMLVCDYDHFNLGSQDIGLYVGSDTPTSLVRSNYVSVYVRDNGQIFTRGFNGDTEFPLAGGATPANIDYLFIDRVDTNVFQAGYYEAGMRNVLVTRTNSIWGIGSTIGFYADVRAVSTRGNVDNLRFATNFVAVPPASPEVFSVLLPTNGVNAAVQGGWYHVAATYNGLEHTANNLTFYWTALSNNAATASVLATFQMTNDLGSASSGTTIQADFAVGNEGRDQPGESFQGFIDEVRVSDTVRAANAFNLDGTPYTADGNTKLLYHLDEANPPNFPTSLVNQASDDVTMNPADLDVRAGASFEAPAYSGAFGTALLTSGNTTDTGGAYATSALPVTDFLDPDTGAFTYEALIRPDFDPNSPNEHMQIISMEGDGGNNRPFQWRFPSRSDMATPLQLEFIKISGGERHLFATVPTAGMHAIVPSNWYHVAVTYNGDESDPNNFIFYWTALDSGVTTANVISVTNLIADLALGTGNFAVGNEERDTSGEDPFVGVVDEVRISKVARSANQFLLTKQVPLPEITSLQVAAGQVTLIWTSEAGASYTIGRSTDLTAAGGGFAPVASGITGTAPATTNTVSTSGVGVGFYRVEVE